MAFNINQFSAAGLPLGGARPSLFQVIVDTPNGVPNVGARIAFTCNASQIPSSDLSVISIPYFGRQLKVAGTRTFPNWTATILNDEDFQVRQAMETWSNLINRHQANLRSAALAASADYRTTATVTQYSKVGVPVRTYRFVNIFPQTIGTIDLSWDNADAVESFTVDFAYDYWDVVAPTTTGSLDV